VTLDDALDALRKAVAEKGHEYVYSEEHDSCYYAAVVNGEPQPACMVGHALVYLGVPADHLVESGWNYMSVVGSVGTGALNDLGYVFDRDAIGVLNVAQRVQDLLDDEKDTSWGAALAEAERFAVRNGGAA
jgi:hypothetical protein